LTRAAGFERMQERFKPGSQRVNTLLERANPRVVAAIL
jgi:hypothetical protein